MELLDLILHIDGTDDPDVAFARLAEGLARRSALRAADWRVAEEEGAWPERDAAAPEDGQDLAVTTIAVRAGAARFAWPAGSTGEDEELLARLVEAFGRVLDRQAARRALEAERDELLQRAEESEALHVLGLAANRTLDPDEVVTLVARSTRSLLGANYVTVSASDGGSLRMLAAVGLRSGISWETDPLAARVIESGRPLVVETDANPLHLDGLDGIGPHEAEEMRAGLGVPLSLFGDTFGALVVGYRRAVSLEPRDTRLALALAGHAAVAISNARLHRALADRSGELERAYEDLRWSSEAKERFFASMSHELRTPLNAILGYQSLLLDGVVGGVEESARDYLDRAHRATRRLLLLVNDVLDLSKIAAGKVELFLRPVDPRALVEEALQTAQPLSLGKDIRVDHSFAPGVPAIVTDGDRVQQILLNLLSNAIKFTARGSVTVHVSPAAGWLEIAVTDTGTGVPPEDQERIFHEFEQVSSESAAAGTGLGLPISRKLARILGGDLTVASTPGEGSTFTLRLPIQRSGTPIASGSGKGDVAENP